jgi:transcriptional regulator with XRE-family HTH domain
MSVSHRIQQIIELKIGNHRGAYAEFARKIGARTGLISDWLSEKAKPGSDYRGKICESYGISQKWFDTGTGEMSEPPPAQPQQAFIISSMERELIAAQTEARIYKELCDKQFDRIENVLIHCERSIGNAIHHEDQPGENTRRAATNAEPTTGSALSARRH